MASAVKYFPFVEDLAEKVHALDADTLKVALTNTAPSTAHRLLSEITDLSTANGYTAGGTTSAQSSSAQSSGTYKLVIADVTFTASGGSIGPFRYAVLLNSTPTSPLKPLILNWDYGTNLTLTDGNSFTVDFSASNGVLQLA